VKANRIGVIVASVAPVIEKLNSSCHPADAVEKP
jgi:hypothetical protein